jgi:TIR domain
VADRPEHQDEGGLGAASEASSFRIFLNYRREDSSGHAGRLYDFLLHGGGGTGFRKEQIFMDIDTVAPGVDFRRVIEDAVGSCDVFIAVIGRRWLQAADAEGRFRLDKANDFVRLEIEAALTRDVPVVPALVQGAEMPSAEKLPETLDDFAHRNAVELSDARWAYDVGRLTAWLKTVDEEKARAERNRAELERKRLLEAVKQNLRA